MRYFAQRAITNEWLHRDLPLTQVERVRELSGGGTITATIPPGLRNLYADDGLRLIEDWGTIIYAVSDDGKSIKQAGIVQPPQEYDLDGNKLVAAGFASYPQGYIRTQSLAAQIQVSPLAMFLEHWTWIQSQQDSNLGVQVIFSLDGPAPDPIGDNENPYRQEWFEAPDMGAAMDELAANTPFDYVEEHAWLDDRQRIPAHYIRVGYPRAGKDRSVGPFAQRFVIGENVIESPPVGSAGDFANAVVGIGNGEGATLVWAHTARRDGRLRRTRVVTDKTIGNVSQMANVTRRVLDTLSPTLDLSSILVKDHRNAPLHDIDLGDDIRVQSELPTYGEIDTKVRILSIGESDDIPGVAVLGVQRSSAFDYNPRENLS